MKILLTNDDGIYSDGIYAIYRELKKIGNVDVVAPESEKSSVGHAITLSHPILYKKVTRKGRFFGYGITGTPADCVKFALKVLLKSKPDLIVSGINLGPNDGCSVHYSGTVAGAREGALNGIPSVALSLDTFTDPRFNVAAQFGARAIKQVLGNKIPNGTFLNINIPAVSKSKIKGFRITRQGTKPIHGNFRKRKDPNLKTYYWMTGTPAVIRKDDGSDTYALENNYVTIAPIQCDSTDDKYYEKLLNRNNV